MNEIEQRVHEAGDAVLINELRYRMNTRSDSNIQKLGIMVLNLGSDALRIMVERNIAGAVPAADEEEEPEPDYEDQTHDDGTIGYDLHGDQWAAMEARDDYHAIQEDAHLEADYEDRASGGWYGEDA